MIVLYGLLHVCWTDISTLFAAYDCSQPKFFVLRHRHHARSETLVIRGEITILYMRLLVVKWSEIALCRCLWHVQLNTIFEGRSYICASRGRQHLIARLMFLWGIVKAHATACVNLGINRRLCDRSIPITHLLLVDGFHDALLSLDVGTGGRAIWLLIDLIPGIFCHLL